MSIASQVRNRDPIWRLIWSWKGSESIRAFLWGVAHDKLTANENRWRRNLTDDPHCHHCSLKKEPMLHVLRDCSLAQDVRMVLLNSRDRRSFFDDGSVPPLEWLTLNMDGCSKGNLGLAGTCSYGRAELWVVVSGPKLALVVGN